MNKRLLRAFLIIVLFGHSNAFAAIADPIVADYGDVFPGLTDVELGVNRATSDAPWFVRFNLLTPADVIMGVNGIEGCNGCQGSFSLTSIRITTFDDDTQNIAFGTDSFLENPFDPNTIDQLVYANNLAPDVYVLAVSGSGNIGNYAEFFTHLQVNPVPLPAAAWLFVSGLIGFVTLRRKID
ncbi:MAG: VPLPA-CTERM sorting domain-containing protein [Candidatus Thiodiazotropha sp. DIVDIV]